MDDDSTPLADAEATLELLKENRDRLNKEGIENLRAKQTVEKQIVAQQEQIIRIMRQMASGSQ